MTRKRHLSRRTVLRGLGTAMALPWLEAMEPAIALAARKNVAATAHPRRIGFLFVPNGMHMPDWTPKTLGYDYDLPFILEPLARVKDEVTVLTGLTHDKGRANGDGPGDHARCASVFLTGAQPRKTAGGNIRSGTSVDQVAAQRIGHLTRFPSLELGCDPGRDAGSCDSGYSCAYSSNISWSSPTTPVAKEVNPRLVFERLFSNDSRQEATGSRGQRDLFRRSVLDFVAEDARRLRAKLAPGDQRKIDEYLTGVREIERRITRVEDQQPPRRDVDGFGVPKGIPDDYQEHLRLMCDMIVLAFQADLTRVSTFMFTNAGSNRTYNPIGVPDGHHYLSHHGGDPEKHAKIRKINRFHVSQLAYLLERLRSVPEGDGTLLDNCMIVYGSGICDGNRHNNENLPILLAGRGDETIQSGRHIVYEYETPLTNLYMAMLDRMGAPVEYVGDSTGRLPRLDG